MIILGSDLRSWRHAYFANLADAIATIEYCIMVRDLSPQYPRKAVSFCAISTCVNVPDQFGHLWAIEPWTTLPVWVTFRNWRVCDSASARGDWYFLSFVAWVPCTYITRRTALPITNDIENSIEVMAGWMPHKQDLRYALGVVTWRRLAMSIVLRDYADRCYMQNLATSNYDHQAARTLT